MLDITDFSPLRLALQHLADMFFSLRAFVCAFCQEEADVKPPRPEPLPDVWTEAKLTSLLQDAPKEDGDCGNSSSEPPDWLDAEKLARARRLHELYWPVISNAQVISLFLSFTFSETARPLVFTGRSDTVPRARRRYLETSLYVLSWALGDVWHKDDTAYSNAERVRTMHRTVARQLEGRDLSEVDLPAPDPPSADRCPLAALRADLGPPPAEPSPAGDAISVCPGRFLSQTDMVLTQWFFVGLIVLHPEKFGLAHLSDDELECFLHFWRSVGHRIGIAERYNLCSGSLTQVRALCLQLERRVLVPQLHQPDRCWLGLTRALYDGLGTVVRQVDHDVFLYYILHDVLGLQTARLFGTLGWLTRLRYRLLRAIYRHANGNSDMHALIRGRSRTQLVSGVEAEKLPGYLTYVFNII